MTPSRLDWDEYVELIAQVGEVAPPLVKPDVRLVEDLGLDSLALAELIAVLIEGGRAPGLSARLEERVWTGVTVEQVFDEYSSGSA